MKNETINTINQLAKTIINCGCENIINQAKITQNHNLIKFDIKLLAISISKARLIFMYVYRVYGENSN